MALDEGLSAGDVVERLEIPKATVSRNLRALGDRVSPQKEGMNLIRMEHDAADYRIRRAYLTERGRAFKEEVILALG
ncbi:TPA: MarR family transcriptional regulator [Vibrio parahaemolyticus]|nr:MarR family transcriptional regulator [Vibrio parahaemolyticus]HCM1516402.1 MarR family transcriptional regulator [Vibrio parahaemolyticus]